MPSIFKVPIPTAVNVALIPDDPLSYVEDKLEVVAAETAL